MQPINLTFRPMIVAIVVFCLAIVLVFIYSISNSSFSFDSFSIVEKSPHYVNPPAIIIRPPPIIVRQKSLFEDDTPIHSLYEEALNAWSFIVDIANSSVCTHHSLVGGKVPNVIERQDGAWAICEVPLSSDCKVMSFGVNDDWSFDDAMIKKGCEVWSVDPTISGVREQPLPPKHHFLQIGLSGKDEVTNYKYLTLASFLTQNNITDLDILKIDIEGYEWEFLRQALPTTLLEDHVKQLTLEIHYAHWDQKYNGCQDDGCRSKAIREEYKLIRDLGRKGFVAWSVHLNGGSTQENFGLFRFPCCYEISYVNMNWLGVSW